ncbi:uncharacterized protein EAE98_005710 [Botrytis deweyae]|uniref:SMP-30/Gluconolactonase/LRE-like region domain-containing protein n=1 Tax=Botrytis deweyae TaxID=2478750 RepID=A0ABQ7IMK1_9HELO|nr:uncharacterized protein EAE98_005710 [Botrytis deweyae]KAF7928654.1 hypothetical protein EAE98_005710 [Botrytis deweyae]
MSLIRPLFLGLASAAALILPSAAQNSSTVVSIPTEYTYLLPAPFEGNPAFSFLNSTTTSDEDVNTLLQSAKTAPFVSYDNEFLALLGPNPSANLVEERALNFAGEAGVWLKERNEVWYTTWINDGATHVEILDLASSTTRNLTTSIPLENPNGGCYHQGLVYFTSLRDDTRNFSGGVYSVDPSTGEAKVILNSYMGLKFDAIDDVAWVTQPGTNRSFMYITVLPSTVGTVTNGLAQGLWRFDPISKILAPVISRTDFPVANGVRPSVDQKSIYITDFGGSPHVPVWGLPAQVGIPGVYKYDFDADMLPVNRRVFSVARMQAPDGIRVDDKGRVWTGEGEGVMVRSPEGKLLGVFNAQFFTPDPINLAIVQFALAGDILVILGMRQLWTVKLSEVVMAASN